MVRTAGLDALLNYGKPGPKEGMRRGLREPVASEPNAKLAAGEFVSAVAAQRWLREARGVKRPYLRPDPRRSPRSSVGCRASGSCEKH